MVETLHVCLGCVFVGKVTFDALADLHTINQKFEAAGIVGFVVELTLDEITSQSFLINQRYADVEW